MNSHRSHSRETRNLIGALTLAFFLLPAAVSAADKRIESFPDERRSLYEASNKEWLAETPIPDDKPGTTSFQVLTDNVEASLRDLLELPENAKSFSPNERKARDLYASYLNFEHRESAGIRPITKDLERIDDLENLEGVFLEFNTLQKIGVTSPVVWEVGSDLQNSKAHLLWLGQSGLGLPARSMYLDEDDRSKAIRRNYTNYLHSLFELSRLKNPEAQAEAVLKLETELARIQWSPEQLRDMSQQYNLRTVTELASMMGIYPVVSSLQSLGLPTDIKINAAHLSYLESLKQFLPSQSLESWKSYLRARLILNYGPMLTKAFHEKQLEYQKALGILKADLPEWRQALQFADACSSLLIGKIYVENFFTEATKNEATKVISEIRASAAKLIGDSKRLSKPTKEKALQKLAKMEFAVGYPEVWPKFEELQTNPEDLVSNYRNAATFELKRNFDSLNKPVDKREWSRSPHEVNAGYIPTENRFVVNAAILHAPFFDEKASEAARYGGLGFVVGHEIGHAFDDMGSHFDSEGNLANWWTEEDRASYDKVKEKIIAQANAFEILPGVHLNGALQVGEIMGDMTGARVAMNVLARFIREQKLDGKTTQRDFFRQLATVWREKIRPEVQKLYIATDPHPPGKFRTDGVVKNMPEFHSAFGTKLGDPMYQIPGKRIQIW